MNLRAGSVRSLGVLSVLLAVLLVTGPGASAASKTVRDATDDVYTLIDETPTKATGPDGDITSVTTAHRKRTVSVKVRARHLSLDQTMLFVRLRTSTTGPAYFFNGTADIGIRMALITRGETRFVRCPGIRTAFRPRRGFVMAVIPRDCLGNPRWVRAGAALATTDSMIDALADESDDPFADEGDGSPGTIDIAGRGGLTHLQTVRLPLGPKVRVG